MAAVAVPPSGWTPIGARELLASARRNFGQGFLLSVIAHGSLLALILWLHASSSDSSIRILQGRVHILVDPAPAPPPVFPPDAVKPPSTKTPPAAEGAIDPVTEQVIVKPPTPSGGGVTRGDETGSDGRTSTPSTVDTAPPRLPPEDAVIRRDTEPVPTFAPKPEYPEWAREAGITGRVLLHVLVDRDGSVADVHVTRSVTGLDDAAVQGIRRWKLIPALFQGHPVAVWIEIPVNFRLEP